MGTLRRFTYLSAVAAVCLLVAVPSVSADDIGSYAFQRIWNRTDEPVQAHTVNRTWMWGPQPFTGVILEPYQQGNVAGQQGVRRVQYFDKSRMEVTDSSADQNSDWYVTNGLLAKEMITGQMQVGNDSYVDYSPANINVAGDENDPDGPTYASLTALMSYRPLPDGWTVTQTIDRQGHVGNDPALGAYGVSAGHLVAGSQHDIASVFWEFMNASGPTYNGFQTADTKLFSNPFFATGLPITEPYWTTVKVGGAPKKVLIQAFERRVLTYTPDNSDGWKVEAGNVGRHYYEWRYGSDTSSVFVTGEESASKDMSGNWVFRGEVTNTGKTTYSNVAVKVTLFSSTGNEVASQSSYLDVSSIQPGQKLPYRVWFDKSVGYDHATTSVTGVVDPFTQSPKLTTLVSTSEFLASGDYHIRTTVRNDSDQPVTRPSYVVALYGADHDVVDYNSGFVTLGTLQPGQTASVDITFYRTPTLFGGYRVIVSR